MTDLSPLARSPQNEMAISINIKDSRTGKFKVKKYTYETVGDKNDILLNLSLVQSENFTLQLLWFVMNNLKG